MNEDAGPGAGLHISGGSGTFRVRLHVQPRASRSEVVGLHGAALKVRVSAPPVDGAANDAVVALVASELGLQRRSVTIIAGEASRQKTLEITGTTEAAIRGMVPGHGTQAARRSGDT